MSEPSKTPHEPVFRSNKRRKIFRKRNFDEDDLPANEQEPGAITSQNGQAEHPQAVKRPAARKGGIGFSSYAQLQAADDQADEHTALVLAPPSAASEDEQSDRFVKPTGKVVVEDKHLTAYLDTKLAALRSPSGTPIPNASHLGISPEPSLQSSSQRELSRTIASAIQPPQSTYQRPSGRQGNSKPRRQPNRPDAESLARDALVESLMRDNAVPIYEPRSTATNTAADDSGETDRDAAAAAAFRASFLADLEESHRRRPPPVAGARAATVTSGPKLGGSRAQRERMKASEDAKFAAAGIAPKK